ERQRQRDRVEGAVQEVREHLQPARPMRPDVWEQLGRERAERRACAAAEAERVAPPLLERGERFVERCLECGVGTLRVVLLQDAPQRLCAISVEQVADKRGRQGWV